MLDYDSDGDLDLYLVQGGPIEPELRQGAVNLPSDRLYRNDLRGGRVELRDVTAAAGLSGATGYGMGVAVGDIDNDGFPDLYLANFGPNQLWRNQGDGRFRDVTSTAGVDDPRWSVSASFLDYDRDGWLDLYVVNYVAYTLAAQRPCYASNSRPEYCGPQSYRPETDRLFRNRGDGTFEDTSARVGLLGSPGPGLGVVAADFDDDGWPDVYVANDQAPNFYWVNLGGQRFEDRALVAGNAVNALGETEAGIGVEAGDLDNDGDDELFVTHLMTQTNTLYRNEGDHLFFDRTQASGLAAPSRNLTGFGVVMLDYDGDSWLDLLTVNGSVKLLEPRPGSDAGYGLEQPGQLFRNFGDGRFAETARESAPDLAAPAVGRGAAAGDLDNDGDLDVLVSVNGGVPRLLLNESSPDRPWAGLRLVGTPGKRDMLGARVTLLDGSGRRLWRRAHSDGSYASARDPRVLFPLDEAGLDEAGLEAGNQPIGVRVTWPDGQVEDRLIERGRYTTVVQGEGKSPATLNQ